MLQEFISWAPYFPSIEKENSWKYAIKNNLRYKRHLDDLNNLETEK